MGNKYTRVPNTSDDIEDRGFKPGLYFRDHGYSKLVGVGTTYKEALNNLSNKCKYNGVWPPKKTSNRTRPLALRDLY